MGMSGAADEIFSIEKLSVSYLFRRAVSDLSLSLSQGESLGLLGINGAGKTSTLHVLLGMVRPRKGRVCVFGGRPGTLRSHRAIGFAPEDGVPPEYLTAREYLAFVATFRISDRVERKNEIQLLLNEFDLPPKKRIREYSKGMVRRLVLAQALLGNPPLLILDEPLNGLDPLMIIKLRERLDQYRKSGGTLLFSSHILAEVEKTCSRVAILHRGQMKYEASLSQLQSDFGSVETAFQTHARESE